VEPLTVSNAVDDHLGVVSALVGNLAAGATVTTTMSYVVRESDLPGPLVNEVVVTANNGDGDTLVQSATAEVAISVEGDDFKTNLPHIGR
jgi:hypothetical protein